MLCSGLTDIVPNGIPDLAEKVKSVVQTFCTLMTLFGKCHMGYSAGVLTDEQIQTLGKLHISFILISGSDINNFMGFYRANFSNSTVFPKLHILEDHVQQWLQHWHIWFGIMGEQGAESLHAHIKKLERQY